MCEHKYQLIEITDAITQTTIEDDKLVHNNEYGNISESYVECYVCGRRWSISTNDRKVKRFINEIDRLKNEHHTRKLVL